MGTAVQNPENADLVRQAVERHQAALQRYAAQLAGGDAIRARGVVQGVLTLLGSQPTGEVGDDLMEWLFTRTRQAALAGAARDGLRKHLDEAGGGADEGAGETAHLTMQRLVDRLTPKQQEALRLKFQYGFTLVEIARITELSATSVSLLVHNAIMRLGSDFAAPEGGPALSDDPRLTVYALGEMEPDERKRFEAAQFDPKAVAGQVTEIRRLTTQITRSLAIEAGAPAPPVRRRRKSPAWWRSGRVWLGAAGAFALLGGGLVGVRNWAVAGEAEAPRPVGDFRLKPAQWKDPGPANAESDEHFGGADAGGGAAVEAAGRSVPAGVAHSGAAPGRAETEERHLSGTGPAPVEAASGKTLSVAGAGPVSAPATPRSADSSSTETGPAQTAPSAIARGRAGALPPSLAVAAEAEGRAGPGAQPAREAAVAPENTEAAARSPPAAAPALPPPAAAASRPAAAPGSPGPADSPAHEKFQSAAQTPTAELPLEADAPPLAPLHHALAQGKWPAPAAVRVEALLNCSPAASAPPPGRQLVQGVSALLQHALQGRQAGPVRGTRPGHAQGPGRRQGQGRPPRDVVVPAADR